MLISLSIATTARAHAPGISLGAYFASASGVDVKLTFARRDLIAQCRSVRDAHGDEPSPSASALVDCLDLPRTMTVAVGSTSCGGAPPVAEWFESDAVLVRASYTCPGSFRAATVRLAWLARMPADHRHIASILSKPEERAFPAHDTSFEVARAVDGDARAAEAESSGAPHGFFLLGVTHILTGLDHLAFVLGLLLAGDGVSRATARPLFYAVTAFSVGHSASLALAVTGVFLPSARVTEPLIAASIIAVGAENLLKRSAQRRYLITLPFGLVHGFGFAEALTKVFRGGVAFSLFTFNLGVECGQLLALVPMMMAVYVVSRRPEVARRTRLAANLLLVTGGALLLVIRLRG